jgi:LAS superfamily LD-carboxypeptidase LdcB
VSEFVDNKVVSIFGEALAFSQNDYKQNFDLNSDCSLQKYISDDLVLENIKYVPADLSQIDSEYIVNRAGRPYLRLPAQTAFEAMAKDFYSTNNQQLYLMSAYRSYNDQATLFE